MLFFPKILYFLTNFLVPLFHLRPGAIRLLHDKLRFHRSDKPRQHQPPRKNIFHTVRVHEAFPNPPPQNNGAVRPHKGTRKKLLHRRVQMHLRYATSCHYFMS